MKLHIVSAAKNVLASDAYLKVLRDVTQALERITANSETKLIINPTLWYIFRISKNGTKEAKPCVINSADYLSKKFGTNLEKLGWSAGHSERTISGQKIDGYIELTSEETQYVLAENTLIEFLSAYRKVHPEDERNAKDLINYFYSRYCASSWTIPPTFNTTLIPYFQNKPPRTIKVGLEFETGNIASSFRALAKLNNLFQKGLIDFGVFITSINKADAAAKIWPESNRNGSFEELIKRDYKSELQIPLLEIGFEPDSFSETAEYLGSNGKTFPLEETGITRKNAKEVLHEYVHTHSRYWRKK